MKRFIILFLAALVLWLPEAQAKRRWVPKPVAASAFNPADYGTVSGWWKADAIVGLVNNDPVASWSDSGPNGYTLAQATGANRPTYKTALQNGLPGVDFGGNAWLNTADIGNKNQPRTVFVVCTTSSGTNQNIVGSRGGGATVYGSGNKPGIYAGTDLPQGTTATGVKIITAYFNGASSTVQVDDNTAGTGNPGSGVYANGYAFGAYNSSGIDRFTGVIYEVIVYDGAASDQAAVKSALRTKWNF